MKKIYAPYIATVVTRYYLHSLNDIILQEWFFIKVFQFTTKEASIYTSGKTCTMAACVLLFLHTITIWAIMLMLCWLNHAYRCVNLYAAVNV